MMKENDNEEEFYKNGHISRAWRKQYFNDHHLCASEFADAYRNAFFIDKGELKEMKTYPMGTMRADDQLFGNEYSINMIDIDGIEWYSKYMRPKNFHGVHALVQTGEDEYNLMCEDDGHFRTHAILTGKMVRELKGQLEKIRDSVTLKPNWRISYGRSYMPVRQHALFPSRIIRRKEIRPLVEIDVAGIAKRKQGERTELVFDISWINEIIEVLDIDKWKEYKGGEC